MKTSCTAKNYSLKPKAAETLQKSILAIDIQEPAKLSKYQPMLDTLRRYNDHIAKDEIEKKF